MTVPRVRIAVPRIAMVKADECGKAVPPVSGSKVSGVGLSTGVGGVYSLRLSCWSSGSTA